MAQELAASEEEALPWRRYILTQFLSDLRDWAMDRELDIDALFAASAAGKPGGAAHPGVPADPT